MVSGLCILLSSMAFLLSSSRHNMYSQGRKLKGRRKRVLQIGTWGKCSPVQVENRLKSPVMGVCLVCLRGNQEALVTSAWWWRETGSLGERGKWDTGKQMVRAEAWTLSEMGATEKVEELWTDFRFERLTGCCAMMSLHRDKVKKGDKLGQCWNNACTCC